MISCYNFKTSNLKKQEDIILDKREFIKLWRPSLDENLIKRDFYLNLLDFNAKKLKDDQKSSCMFVLNRMDDNNLNKYFTSEISTHCYIYNTEVFFLNYDREFMMQKVLFYDINSSNFSNELIICKLQDLNQCYLTSNYKYIYAVNFSRNLFHF